jgi:hypothetical protein
VTPGNTLFTQVTTTPEGTTIVQEAGPCPRSFKPAADNSFRSRLTFSFAIGQAF